MSATVPRTHWQYGAERPAETLSDPPARPCDPISVRQRLDALSAEMGRLSSSLNGVLEQLEESEQWYQDTLEKHEVDLYLECERRGKRLPSEKLREKLARRQMDPVDLGTRDGLQMKRHRLQERISHLRKQIDAERSILSALKEEMSATTQRF